MENIVPTGDVSEQVECEYDIELDNAILTAAIEYRASGSYHNLVKPNHEHGERAMRAIKAREAQQFKFAQMDGADAWQERLRLGNFFSPGEPSEKTAKAVAAIRAKHPTQFVYGARAGFYVAAHDTELFKHWTSGERDAFFCGYSHGRNQRRSVAAVKEAAE